MPTKKMRIWFDRRVARSRLRDKLTMSKLGHPEPVPHTGSRYAVIEGSIYKFFQRTLFLFALFIFLSSSSPALVINIIHLKAPKESLVSIKNVSIAPYPEKGLYTLYIPDNLTFPTTISVRGPLGGLVEKTMYSLGDFSKIKIKNGIIKNKDPNPPYLDRLPSLCPKIKLVSKPTSQGQNYEAIYNAVKDGLNNIPSLQIAEKDALYREQWKAYQEMDGKNVLKLLKVRLDYDYEDDAIIDYVGPNPITGQHQVIHEGNGGFYSNLHYAVMPYSEKIMTADKQTLLHMAQGTLQEIDKEDLRPRLRTHAFIPGPFLSGKRYGYTQCEWGDTQYQTKHQQVSYKNMALWDWDYSIPNNNRVIIVVWEGDEEDWLIEKKAIDPFYLTDDLVGVFDVKLPDTLKPLVLKNKSKDFEMTVQTGNIKLELDLSNKIKYF